MLVLYPSNNKSKFKDVNNSKAEYGFGTDYGSVTLHHSPECPLWKLHDYGTTNPSLPSKIRGINVGVTILLESSDSRILLTQRSDKMRTFPRAWVPPGGNLEVGETPLQGALREMEEEAGLALNPSNSEASLLCLWESVYPALLLLGKPRSHHIVLYFHIKSRESWEELQAKIKLDPEEVKACTWLTRDNVRSLYAQTDEATIIKQFIVMENGEIQPAELDINRMFHRDLWRDKSIYTGSQLALTKWMENPSISSKM
ncbi:hypothetical protein L9F63_013304 [Diploptera punctata]|uniref:m7GpppN-mRNA hydrolase NUDT17 n=1 Tax=Diploptera punctata TaxID=6984 RepID=A0AAD8AAJ9_DIPPU|nr:hypothetical protein L9F63_013304 [Diploptera punctata]